VNETIEQAKSKKSKSGALTASGFGSSFLALVSASCCVLPFFLLNLGVGGALVGRLALFARYKDWFLGASVLLIVIAIIFAFSGGRRPSRFVTLWLFMSILLVILAYVLPNFEGEILSWLQSKQA